MHRGVSLRTSRIVSIVVLLMAAIMPFLPDVAQATPTSLTETMIRLNRMKAGATTGATICAKPTTVASTEGKLQIFLPTGFTIDTTPGNWTVNTTNLPADPNGGGAATIWPGITVTGIAFGLAGGGFGPNITFTSGDLTSGSAYYCFNITSATITNASAANNLEGYMQTETSASALIDTGYVALATVTNDQVVISAIVPPLFSFALASNIDAFTTNLSPTAIVRTTGQSFTVSTNAPNGWTSWVLDNNSPAGLHSSVAAYTIASLGLGTNTLSSGGGAEQYGLYGDTTPNGSGCSSTIAPAYLPHNVANTDGGTYNVPLDAGGVSSTAYQALANCTGGTSAGDTVNFREAAVIKTNTPAAADYTDTLTIVGAGNF